MRELLTGSTEHTTVAAVDEPSHGGACHIYEVIMVDPSDKALGYSTRTQRIMFQKGPVKEHGVNGITEEDLICILIDRFEGFQRGKYSCPENAFVLTYLQGALARLKDRTQRRQAAGIEGTSAKDPMCANAQAKADEQNTERGEAVEEKAYQPSAPTPSPDVDISVCSDCDHLTTIDDAPHCPLDECEFKPKPEKTKS